MLDAVVEGGVGNAVPVLDAGGAELDIVPGVGFFHAHVVRDAQAELVRFILGRFHDVAMDAQELDAVGALCFESR